jgi:hypothetical protein
MEAAGIDRLTVGACRFVCRFQPNSTFLHGFRRMQSL